MIKKVEGYQIYSVFRDFMKCTLLVELDFKY